MGGIVSVIIPTYNRAALVTRALMSALAQTYADTEVVVVDDNSTDDTELAMAKYIGQSIYLKTPHRGRPAIPRNHGIQVAKGEWIAFLDDDDLWLPEKLKRQLDALQQTSCLASCTNAWRVTGGKRVGTYFGHKLPEIFDFDYLLKANMVICSSVVIHRSLFDTVQGFPEDEALKAIEDYALWLRVATKTNFVYINEPLIEYTDEPSESIRKEDLSEYEQKRRLVRNFLVWAKFAHCPARYASLVKGAWFKQALREFMRDLQRMIRKRHE